VNSCHSGVHLRSYRGQYKVYLIECVSFAFSVRVRQIRVTINIRFHRLTVTFNHDRLLITDWHKMVELAIVLNVQAATGVTRKLKTNIGSIRLYTTLCDSSPFV
jgi:hypothetical protein